MAEKGHRRKIWANLAAEISGVGRWARCKQKVSKTGFPRLNRSLYNIHICICPEGRLQRLTSIPADLLYLPKSTPFFHNSAWRNLPLRLLLPMAHARHKLPDTTASQ